MDIEQALSLLSSQSDYQILKRVPESFNYSGPPPTDKTFTAAIIDLETTGIDVETSEIIELGLVGFTFSNHSGILKTTDVISQLQQPKEPITEEITQITGITNEDVRGKSINWDQFNDVISRTDLIICHNASFDRVFLEKRTPDKTQTLVENSIFGCSANDIDWRALGFESIKLEYLNFKMGYFYSGHRATTDCYATLNLLVQQPKSFDQLKSNVKKVETLVCAVQAPFDKKDILKERGYRWSDGNGSLPKCWFAMIDNIEEETAFLQDHIYTNYMPELPQKLINCRNRYSDRAFTIKE